MKDDNFLLDSIDRLTLNHITKVLQTKQVGDLEIACISDVDHAPLLRMLRDAVATGNDGKNGATSGSSFLPINPAAVEMWDAIVKQINTWHRALPAPREHKYIWERLREWYVDYENRRRAGKITESMEADTLKLVEGWARNISAMFDPPVTLEITSPCPICGERWAFDPRTGDQIGALIIEYRNVGAETLDKATGLCRSCANVWHGRSALRELRFDIETHEEVA